MKVTLSVEDCQIYEIVAPTFPVPAALLANAAGSPPLQIVCAAAIVPATGTDWTVTVSTLDADD